MAYATSNPPRVIAPGGMVGPRIWYYVKNDTDSDVDAADYFSNGDDLGMKLGDILFHHDTSAGTEGMTPMFVSAVTSGGAATVTSQKFV